MEAMVAVASEKFFELLLGAFLAIVAFFSKRTLNGYDRRILETERKQDRILRSIVEIEKSLVKVATRLEHMRK